MNWRWIAAIFALTAASCATPRAPSSGYEPFEIAAGGAYADWKLSGYRSLDQANLSWRIVVIQGTPPEADVWRYAISQVREGREIYVADRPG
ncbi:MAG: hypothetical protein ABW199_11640, partial [Caulobacterales bacterium]